MAALTLLSEGNVVVGGLETDCEGTFIVGLIATISNTTNALLS